MAVKTFTTGEVLTSSDTNTYLANAGLVYVTSVNVGSSAVSTLQMANIFSSTYDAYRLILTGGTANSALAFGVQLGTGSAGSMTLSTTGYYWNLIYQSYTGGGIGLLSASNGSSFPYSGTASTNHQQFEFEITAPYLAKYTSIRALFDSTTESGQHTGLHQVASSYTGISISVSPNTITNGTCTVYGYRKA